MNIIEKYYGKHVNLRLKMFRVILAVWAIGLFLNACLYIAVFHQGPNIYLFPIVGVLVLAFVIWLSSKVKNYQGMIFWFLIMAIIVLFPLAFLTSGGVNSGNPIWLLTGILMSELLLGGWRKYVMLLCAVLVDAVVYITGIFKPEYVTPLENDMMAYADSAVSLLIVALMMWLVFQYQDKVYKQERELAEQRKREVEEISDSKSLFFANMSHEIRTPINTIIGLNEMILREDVSEEVAENAINIQNASKTLLALINDILDISKMESGKMEIVPTQYETASMFSDLVNIIWVRANQKGLDFRVDIAEDIPSMLYGDDVRIKQVLTNILTNAVKYTEKGSVTLTVTSEKLDANELRLKIVVEDTGIGIKRENLEDLFTVFRRMDQEKTNKIEGTGLGLALSKQLVEMMGGSIKVDSIYQKGSVFTITIDQGIIDSKPFGSMRHAMRRSASNRVKYERSFEASGARVLVVDDNEMNLMVAKKLLRDTKVQVDLVSSGKECLELTKENNYHVILMDHMMPEMDGEETLHILRTRQEGFCQKTPVIALTAHVMANAVSLYKEKGFDGYLAKPISGNLLEAALLEFLPQELIEYQAEGAAGGDVPEYTSMAFHKKKKKTAVCAECICDLPEDLIEKHDIKLMYYYVMTEDGRFIDGEEVDSSKLMEYMEKGKSAYSKVASLEEYEAFFADRLMEAEQVLFITVASQVHNKGYENAAQAAKSFGNVTVVNSGQVSSGIGLMVLKAAGLAADGVEMDEIVAALEKMRDKVSLSFMLRTVENMYLNKRIGHNLYRISKTLDLHPVIRTNQSRFELGGIQMGQSDVVVRRYIRSCLRRRKSIDRQLLFITYVGMTPKELTMIKNEVEKRVQFKEIRFQRACATISSNSGVGTFGLIYARK